MAIKGKYNDNLISITIPVKSYLKQYLVCRYRLRNARLRVSSRNSIGVFVLKTLERASTHNHKGVKIAYDSKLTIDLPENILDKYGYFISKENVYFFNQFAQELFIEHFDMYYKTQKRFNEKVEIKTSLSDFLFDFDIDENKIAFETLIKQYQRYRNAGHLFEYHN